MVVQRFFCLFTAKRSSLELLLPSIDYWKVYLSNRFVLFCLLTLNNRCFKPVIEQRNILYVQSTPYKESASRELSFKLQFQMRQLLYIRLFQAVFVELRTVHAQSVFEAKRYKRLAGDSTRKNKQKIRNNVSSFKASFSKKTSLKTGRVTV